MPTIWWLATLKTLQKIVRENALDDEKKRPELKFNPGLALIGLRTTGPMTLISFWCLKGGRLFGTGCLILFWETTKCSKNFNNYIKTNNIWNCNSNKYPWRWMLTWRTYLETCWACTDGTFSFLIFTSLKKAHSENKVQVKVSGFVVSERVNFQSSSIF